MYFNGGQILWNFLVVTTDRFENNSCQRYAGSIHFTDPTVSIICNPASTNHFSNLPQKYFVCDPQFTPFQSSLAVSYGMVLLDWKTWVSIALNLFVSRQLSAVCPERRYNYNGKKNLSCQRYGVE
jgi:hypothetical protein